MTSVTRLHNLFKELEVRKEEEVLKSWKNIFNTSNIFEVYNYLSSVNKELELLEHELTEKKLINNTQFKNIINTINMVINHPHLTQRISQIPVMIPDNIVKVNIAFESLQTFIDAQLLELKFEKEVEEDKFDNFKNIINETIEKIENSDMSDEDKKIFLSVFYDFNKAISLYKIKGLDAFWEVIQNDICKIKIINKFEDEQENGTYNKLKTVLLNSLNEVWFWIQIYQKTDQTLKIGSKAYRYIKDKVIELTEDIEVSE